LDDCFGLTPIDSGIWIRLFVIKKLGVILASYIASLEQRIVPKQSLQLASTPAAPAHFVPNVLWDMDRRIAKKEGMQERRLWELAIEDQ